MKKLLLPVVLILFSFVTIKAQMIENFDATATDPTYQVSIENTDVSYLILSQNTTDKIEGAASLQMKIKIGSLHQWGSYAQLIKRVPVGEPYLDWTINDSLKIWIKVLTPPTIPENMVFRIHIADRLTDDGPIEEYIYEHATILDASVGWVQLVVPLYERETDGTTVPNDQGFVLFPTTWGGGSYNNQQLDYDKIIGFNISAITSGWDPVNNLPADSLEILVDKFERTGLKSIPAIIFNGMTVPGGFFMWAWGQSSLGVEENAGYTPNTNALKWIQGNEWNNGWTGMGFTIIPPFNLAGSWHQDSVKFKMKAQEGVGAIRVQFESGPEGSRQKRGIVFTPTADNQWYSYKYALRDFTNQDNTTGFDSSDVTVVGMMAEGTGIAGKVIFIDDFWTGNPVFDVVPPLPVQGIGVVAGTFQNLVTWNDVPDESQETYSIYYSRQPITDINSADVVAMRITENNQMVTHVLRAPVTNQSVTYYYAVTCTDKAGNVSQPAFYNSPTVNTAKGVATLSLSAPTNFAADGNLGEWSSIAPIVMKKSDGSAFEVTNMPINGDADLSAKAYVAFDNTYLYVAFDVEDDIVSVDTMLASYLNDAPDIFLGLYNWRGKPHANYQRGMYPDYQIRFAQNKMIFEGKGDLMYPGENYYWEEKFPTGYVVEARIPLQRLADMGGDNLFVAVEGYRIPLDFSFNDADATGSREGILTYSPNNEDLSWQSPSRWLYTWIGSLWDPVAVNDPEFAPVDYNLSQNYPNPFNPETMISYSLKSEGSVSLKIFDVLGREVVTLVNQVQNAGNYTVSFNASNLSSGIYFYKLESGSFISIKKMMLLK
jgi:hypothetical protein